MRAIALLAILSSASPATLAEEPKAKPDAFEALAEQFQTTIRPTIQQYCLGCHSADKLEGELDLERFATLTDIRRDEKVWQKVAEMLDHKEMPPKRAKQPTAEQKTQLRGWVERYLYAEALAHAGDPGPVLLRRLSNAEYTYTLRDLTGLSTLAPAREFPVDGAAGEGFTNTGNALVMSPALLTKYLDAAKQVAAHAVLLPDGFRFAPGTTRRDWTNELLAEIRGFYREFSDSRGSEQVNLQGIVFNTNDGGRLPLEQYLAATLAERSALATGARTIADLAKDRNLNAKYLGTLWKSLTSTEPSLLLDVIRSRWRTAKASEAAALTSEIAVWQRTLSRFTTVGQIGKVGGPKRWLEPVDPVVARQEVRFKVPATSESQEVVLSLLASDAGDGNTHDFVVWQRPRLVAPGRPELLLRDVRAVARDLTMRREQVFAHASAYLAAADEAATRQGHADINQLAKTHAIEPDALRAWLDYLGIGSGDAVQLQGYLAHQKTKGSGYDFINGWGNPDLPELVANSSGQHVRIPGNMKPHSVAVHPSPTLRVAVGWRSPVTATVRIEGVVTHAHPECGNGVTWSLERRRGQTRQRLAAGVAAGSKAVNIGPIESLEVQTGDLVSVLIGPRDGNHACDLTAIDWKLSSPGAGGRTWDLAADVSSDVLSGNPHADRFGNAAVWHFYTEPDRGGATGPVIPAGSLIAKWQAAKGKDDRRRLAEDFQKLLVSGPPTSSHSPDATLYRQLASLGGPLFSAMLRTRVGDRTDATSPNGSQSKDFAKGQTNWGLDSAQFGKHPNGHAIDADSLCVHAPSAVEIRLPADLVAGSELVATGLLDKDTGAEGSVQLDVVAGSPGPQSGPRPGRPIIANDGSPARATCRVGVRAVPCVVPGGSLLHQDRPGGRSHHAHAVLPGG